MSENPSSPLHPRRPKIPCQVQYRSCHRGAAAEAAWGTVVLGLGPAARVVDVLESSTGAPRRLQRDLARNRWIDRDLARPETSADSVGRVPSGYKTHVRKVGLLQPRQASQQRTRRRSGTLPISKHVRVMSGAHTLQHVVNRRRTIAAIAAFGRQTEVVISPQLDVFDHHLLPYGFKPEKKKHLPPRADCPYRQHVR